MEVNVTTEPWGLRRRAGARYLVLAALTAAGQATLLFLLTVGQIARFEHAGAGRYTPPVLDALVEVLSAPIFLFIRPEWTFWLRPYLGNDIWIIGLLVAMNALSWGVAIAGLTWCWNRSLARQRLLATVGVVGLVCLVVVLTMIGVIYCHRGFAGALHCHSFSTPAHDH
jgi:hypothetical protein